MLTVYDRDFRNIRPQSNAAIINKTPTAYISKLYLEANNRLRTFYSPQAAISNTDYFVFGGVYLPLKYS